MLPSVSEYITQLFGNKLDLDLSLSGEMHKNIRQKHALRKKLRALKNDTDLAYYEAMRSTVKSMIEKVLK